MRSHSGPAPTWANPRDSHESIRSERVGEGFFEVVGVEIAPGRSFRPADETEDSRVVIVNETMASETWPGEDPVGQVLDVEQDRYEVIGVAPDFRSGAILERSRMGVFLPMPPSGFERPSAQGVTLLVRTDPGVDIRSAIRNEIAAIDPNLTLFNVSLLSDQIETMMYMVRLVMFVYGGIGVFGLILAAVGLGGVTAYAVAQRAKEIGIRMALGAQRTQVLKLVLKEGAILVVVGTFIGQILAFGTTRAMGSYFDALTTITETTTTDPIVVVGAPVLLGHPHDARLLPAGTPVHPGRPARGSPSGVRARPAESTSRRRNTKRIPSLFPICV